MLETALQLLPAHQQLAAAKPQLDGRVQKAASVSGAGWDWQQQQQQAAPNGVMPQAPVNGMELSRCVCVGGEGGVCTAIAVTCHSLLLPLS